MGEDAATARRLQLLTGERTAPGIAQEAYWFARHEAAYAWATGALGPVHRALDAGCGEGYGTKALRQVATMACGLELDELTARHARVTYPDACFLRANLVALPLRDRSFDLVASMQVIEHLWDVRAYLGEIVRVLAPGGHACITTPNRPVFSPGLERGQRPVNPFHVEEFDAHQLRELLSEAGLVDVRIHGLGHGPRIAAWELAHGSLVGALIASISGEPSPPDLGPFTESVTLQDFSITDSSGTESNTFDADVTHLGNLDQSPVQDLIAIGRAP